MEKLLTFSVAAYNVEKYLDQLISSIVNAKKAEKIEVLIVNDGSKDRTAEKTEEYVERYPGIVRLINKDNGGHGSTINTGMQEATGRYFRALDGDDWINTEDLEKLLEVLSNESADAILCNYLSCYEDGKIVKEDFQGLQSGKRYALEQIAPIVQWMRYHTLIYKTSILQEHCIRLDENCFYVDSEFMLFPIPSINSVRFYEWHIYCYRLGMEGQSVSLEGRLKHAEESYKVTLSLLEMYKNLPPDISSEKKLYIANGIAGHCIWHFRTLMSYKPAKEKKSKLVEYECLIRACSEDIYYGMEKFGKSSKLIKIMRCTKYLAYIPVCIYKQIKSQKQKGKKS